MKKNLKILSATMAAILLPFSALAHPHVFADAKLELIIENGAVSKLRHVWRFDDFFSANVQLEFDKDGSGALDATEIAEVAAVIKSSTADFNYFHTVFLDGREVTMEVPDDIILDFVDGQMIMIFQSQPGRPITMTGKSSYGIFDPTFYTSIEFFDDSDITVSGMPKNCTSAIVRPDPDEVLEQNQGSLTEQFFAESEQNDVSRMFATRLELTCS